jgi:ABC-type uncharacterized transport system auxiliary subunit
MKKINMNPYVSSLFKSALLIVVVSNLAGCFGLGSKDEVDEQPHYYVIDVDRGAVANSFPDKRSLLIKPVRVTSHYRTKNIAFRIDENEYAYQPNQFLLSDPEAMFTDQLRRWLQKSGQFSSVTTDETIDTDMVLETALTGLFGDNREQYTPQAVLEMQFFLMDTTEQNAQPLFQTGLKVEVDIDKTTVPNVVNGWKQGLEELLATLESDLSGYFSKRSP